MSFYFQKQILQHKPLDAAADTHQFLKLDIFLIRYFQYLYRLFFKNQEVGKMLGVLLFRQKLRLFLRLVLQPKVALLWLEFILREPLCFRGYGLQLYRRLQKPLRPYLNKSYNAEQRLKALQEHFECLKPLFCVNQPVLSAIKGDGLPLAVFTGKKQNGYELHLAETDHFDREGEFRLTLRDAKNNTQIAVVAFTLSASPKRRLDIGCLQGHQAGPGVAFVRCITRDLYGIRPKNLLMFALYDLAEAWGIQSIRAIDNQQRIYARQKGIFKYRAYAFADYDAFWKELGGEHQGQGWFKLPEHLLQRNAEAVPSKHRAEHRRKLKIRKEIRDQISGWF